MRHRRTTSSAHLCGAASGVMPHPRLIRFAAVGVVAHTPSPEFNEPAFRHKSVHGGHEFGGSRLTTIPPRKRPNRCGVHPRDALAGGLTPPPFVMKWCRTAHQTGKVRRMTFSAEEIRDIAACPAAREPATAARRKIDLPHAQRREFRRRARAVSRRRFAWPEYATHRSVRIRHPIISLWASPAHLSLRKTRTA